MLRELDLADFGVVSIACFQVELFRWLVGIQDDFDGSAIYGLGFAVALSSFWSVDGPIFFDTLFEISREPFHVLVDVDLTTDFFRTLS